MPGKVPQMRGPFLTQETEYMFRVIFFPHCGHSKSKQQSPLGLDNIFDQVTLTAPHKRD